MMKEDNKYNITELEPIDAEHSFLYNRLLGTKSVCEQFTIEQMENSVMSLVSLELEKYVNSHPDFPAFNEAMVMRALVEKEGTEAWYKYKYYLDSCNNLEAVITRLNSDLPIYVSSHSDDNDIISICAGYLAITVKDYELSNLMLYRVIRNEETLGNNADSSGKNYITTWMTTAWLTNFAQWYENTIKKTVIEKPKHENNSGKHIIEEKNNREQTKKTGYEKKEGKHQKEITGANNRKVGNSNGTEIKRRIVIIIIASVLFALILHSPVLFWIGILAALIVFLEYKRVLPNRQLNRYFDKVEDRVAKKPQNRTISFSKSNNEEYRHLSEGKRTVEQPVVQPSKKNVKEILSEWELEEDHQRKAEEEAKRKAAEEAKRKAEEEVVRKAAEEAKRKAEEERKRTFEEDEFRTEETKQKTENIKEKENMNNSIPVVTTDSLNGAVDSVLLSTTERVDTGYRAMGQYQGSIESAKRGAIEDLRRQAFENNCRGIVGLKFEFIHFVVDGYVQTFISAYATGVK